MVGGYGGTSQYTAPIGPPTAAQAAAQAGAGTTLGQVGIGMQIGAAFGQAVGAYYSVQAAQYQARAQASALEYEQQLGFIAARAAERHAQQLLQAGQREAGRAGLHYGQAKAGMEARQSARGIQGGVGSAAEVIASIDLAKEVDQLAITRNAVRAASAARTGRVAELNRGRMLGATAGSLRLSAGSMSRTLGAGTSLLGSGGSVARNWYQFGRTT